jgi:hypothetical protein
MTAWEFGLIVFAAVAAVGVIFANAKKEECPPSTEHFFIDGPPPPPANVAMKKGM